MTEERDRSAPADEPITLHAYDPAWPARFRSEAVLRFRDHLRAHPRAAEEYAALKRELAARHAADRNAYTDGKSAMVAAILATP